LVASCNLSSSEYLYVSDSELLLNHRLSSVTITGRRRSRAHGTRRFGWVTRSGPTPAAPAPAGGSWKATWFTGGACIGTPCLAGRWKLCWRCRPPKASRNCSPSPLLIIGKPSTHSSSRRCHCPLVSRFVPRTYGSPERDPERPQKTEKRQRGIPKLKLKPEKVRRVYLFSVPHFAIRAYLLRLPPHPPLRSSAPS